MAPIELPVGVITALIGGPFFLWLLVGREVERYRVDHRARGRVYGGDGGSGGYHHRDNRVSRVNQFDSAYSADSVV